MRYFKLGDMVFAYDKNQTDLITEDMVEIKGKDLEVILNPKQSQSLFRSLTNRQFKLALLNNDLIDLVDTAIRNIEDPKLKRKIQIEYEYAATFNRDSESISIMIELLGIQSEVVDQIWINALTI